MHSPVPVWQRASTAGSASARLGALLRILLASLLLLFPTNQLRAEEKLAPPPLPAASIPGGSLEAHERAGGHLLERHVGKSAEQLRQRLQTDTRISAASSFTNKQAAETAAGACIASNQRKLAAWMKGDNDRLVITHRAPGPVGISMRRGDAKARDALGVRLVLVRDARFAGGWRILTGYPEP